MKNPRIAVTVTESQYSTLKRLAVVNGQSMSSVVGELVDTVEPVLKRVADLCEFASKARNEQRDMLRKHMEESQAELEPLILRALRVLGVGPEGVQAGLGKAAPAAGKGPQGRRGPPSGNHGGQVGSMEGE